MATWVEWVTGCLWANGLAVLAPALLVLLVARTGRLSPATRHALWLMVLGLIVAPPIGGWLRPSPNGAASEGDGTMATGGGGSAEVDRPPANIDRAATNTTFDSETPPRTGVGVEPMASTRLAWTPPATRHPSTLDAPDGPAPGAPAAPSSIPGDDTAAKSAASPVDSAPPESFAWPPDAAAAPAVSVDSPIGAAVAAPASPLPAQPPFTLAAAIARTAALLGSAREALSRVPQIPTHVWILGTLLIAAARLASAWQGRRLMARSRLAPPSMRRKVAQCARRLQLSRMPEVRLIDRPCPPMVIGLRRCVLLVPPVLWRQLDAIGREAILLHELAHVRRRDLWVRRFGRLVSALCWWHPLVWYARRRLDEEAELCCDAWVTRLMPARRREYALALLAAQSFVRSSHPVEPGAGIGVVSVRAKRFTRRLTMVMTHPSRPALSLGGAAAVMLVALAGWLTAPAWAEPPTLFAAAADGPAHTPPPPPPDAPAPPSGAGPAQADPPGHAAPAPSALFAAGLPGGPASNVDNRLEDRMERLETQLRRLEEHLARMVAVTGAAPLTTAAPPVRAHGGAAAGPIQPRTPSAPVAPRAWAAQQPKGAIGKTAPSGATPKVAGGHGSGQGMSSGGGAVAAAQPGVMVTRRYTLTEGKLDALLALMARDDMPGFVARADDAIEFTGTPAQQEAFGVFIRLIEPEAGAGGQSSIGVTQPGHEYLAAVEQALHQAAIAQRAKGHAKMQAADAQRSREAEEQALSNHLRDLAVSQSELARRAVEAERAAVANLLRDRSRTADEHGRPYAEGMSAYSQGDYEAAIDAFRQSVELNHLRGASLYNMACCEALLGNSDESLDLLEQAWEAGYQDLEHIRGDDDLDSLRDDERFEAFLEHRTMR